MGAAAAEGRRGAQKPGCRAAGGNLGSKTTRTLVKEKRPSVSGTSASMGDVLGLQVILLKDVPGTGLKGELARVNNGYLRNFLLPQKFAVPATAGILECIASHSLPVVTAVCDGSVATLRCSNLCDTAACTIMQAAASFGCDSKQCTESTVAEPSACVTRLQADTEEG